jgi:hypothetical protein
MGWTADDADRLRDAIARGVRKVQYADKTIVYQDPDDMLKVLGQIEAEVAAEAGTSSTRPTIRRYAGASSGW